MMILTDTYRKVRMIELIIEPRPHLYTINIEAFLLQDSTSAQLHSHTHRYALSLPKSLQYQLYLASPNSNGFYL